MKKFIEDHKEGMFLPFLGSLFAVGAVIYERKLISDTVLVEGGLWFIGVSIVVFVCYQGYKNRSGLRA